MASRILFSTFSVTSQVFYRTKFTYAVVNLKPIVPGHVSINRNSSLGFGRRR
ncbi:unnamed protein product [Kuraishia capsulata CBS 1993]|uniref:HIT domain-containing protein n=1 Tax=Kuraishia capsulata CBS 1993 TaxID=1382522 RepID=W6MRL3_9ASCO|nr:uncharacterized protein KUCA_T00005342001 [Kuraishia capsulata CBS 1993]CDK29354.1 unnamed protein product [Kuraishia capsulata CBS 1993]